jgi:hypothetical protein
MQTGQAAIIAIVAIGIAIVVTLVIIDATTKPPPTPGTCDLKHNFLLPDKCVCSEEPRPDCGARTTRPYAFFFTQAATCNTLCDVVFGCIENKQKDWS